MSSLSAQRLLGYYPRLLQLTLSVCQIRQRLILIRWQAWVSVVVAWGSSIHSTTWPHSCNRIWISFRVVVDGVCSNKTLPQRVLTRMNLRLVIELRLLSTRTLELRVAFNLVLASNKLVCFDLIVSNDLIDFGGVIMLQSIHHHIIALL